MPETGKRLAGVESSASPPGLSRRELKCRIRGCSRPAQPPRVDAFFSTGDRHSASGPGGCEMCGGTMLLCACWELTPVRIQPALARSVFGVLMHRSAMMAAFAELDWSRIDVTAIVACA